MRRLLARLEIYQIPHYFHCASVYGRTHSHFAKGASLGSCTPPCESDGLATASDLSPQPIKLVLLSCLTLHPSIPFSSVSILSPHPMSSEKKGKEAATDVVDEIFDVNKSDNVYAICGLVKPLVCYDVVLPLRDDLSVPYIGPSQSIYQRRYSLFGH